MLTEGLALLMEELDVRQTSDVDGWTGTVDGRTGGKTSDVDGWTGSRADGGIMDSDVKFWTEDSGRIDGETDDNRVSVEL